VTRRTPPALERSTPRSGRRPVPTEDRGNEGEGTDSPSPRPAALAMAGNFPIRITWMISPDAFPQQRGIGHLAAGSEAENGVTG
jgi:hypothetical protein